MASGDFINVVDIASGNGPSSQATTAMLNHIENIDLILQSWGRTGKISSQSGIKNDDPSTAFRRQHSDGVNLNGLRSWSRNTQKGFLDSFEQALFDGFGGSKFKQNVSNIFGHFANQLNTDISGIPGKFGTLMGQQAINAFKQGKFGGKIAKTLDDAQKTFATSLTNHGSNIIGMLQSPNGISFSGVMGELTSVVGDTAGALTSLGPAALGVGAALIAIEIASEQFMEGIKDIGSGISQIFSAFSAAANRDVKTREENLKAYKARMAADYETMVKYPFELLEKAASELYDSWNSNLGTVSATQGYTKEDVQDLMSVLAERIRKDELSSYISGTSLFNNLAKVLESGLSGKVAEEFAYQATVLNKAIPTQDFFSYASTYSSIAANAIREGKSQEDALKEANASLNDFASSLLYTSRELTGGFSTGLKNATALYENASKIALAANSDNLSAISSSLVAVQGYVGAVAPDLAESLTSTIYSLATGGNSQSAVALRSLAGVNASNTEFLRAFAENPQQILSTMFDTLATMYEQSPDAYMEKAEGYASLFGLSSEAFQRIDFNGLADAVRNMNTSDEALNENMKLLLQGQTTTTAEQLKAQQINEYMYEEGLAYLIDNEVAQQIQQHMWQEQIAREVVQSQFSVDLVGDSQEGLQKIVNGIQKIIDIINPLSWLRKIGNLISTSDEAAEQQADVAQMLELGKVGKGRAIDFTRLTTGNANLNLTKPLVELMGGTANYQSGIGGIIGDFNDLWDVSSATNSISSVINTAKMGGAYSVFSEILDEATRVTRVPTSQYNWGTSKLQGKLASAILNSGSAGFSLASASTSSAATPSTTANAAKSAIQKMLEDSYVQEQFIKQGKSYEEWASTASDFGISDFAKALESAGYTVSSVQEWFSQKEGETAADAQHERNVREDKFWEQGTNFWETRFWSEYNDPLFTHMDTIETKLQDLYDQQGLWMKSWQADWLETRWDTIFSKEASSPFMTMYREISDYVLNRSYYGGSKDATQSQLWESLTKVTEDAKNEDRESTANRIGQVLSDTMLGADQTDPTLQTNILLGQILVYVGQIVQQTNGAVGGVSLIDQLSAMSLGLTQKTP